MKNPRPVRLRNLKLLIALLGFFVFVAGGAVCAQIPFTPQGSGQGSGSEATADQSANAGHNLDVRLNYFKRFPYAKAASETQLGGADVLIPVESGHSMMQSASKKDSKGDSPSRTVAVYQPVIKYCNDD